MCRNIRPLNNFAPPATNEEVHDAALQYVRKVAGATRPSQANQMIFDESVAMIADQTRRLLDGLVSSAPAKDREEESAKRRARAGARTR